MIYRTLSLACALFILSLNFRVQLAHARISEPTVDRALEQTIQPPTSGPCSDVTVVFDMGEVLVTTDIMAAFQELGVLDIALYSAHTGKHPSKLKPKMYAILNKIKPYPETIPAKMRPRDHEGDQLPMLMCDWMTGEISGPAIWEHIKTTLQETPKRFRFSCPAEKRLVRRMMRMMFTPERFVKTRVLNDNAVAFARRCKALGCRLAILSNWDADSFPLMQNKFPELFDLFDEKDIFLSGRLGHMKPDPETFKRVRKAIRQDNPDGLIIFIDDQPENIHAAASYLCPILCRSKKGAFGTTSPNFASVNTQFRKILTEQREHFSTAYLPV